MPADLAESLKRILAAQLGPSYPPEYFSDETPLLLLDISGFRGGVRYNLGGWYSNTAAVRGSAVFLDEFPVDYYGIYSVSCKAKSNLPCFCAEMNFVTCSRK